MIVRALYSLLIALLTPVALIVEWLHARGDRSSTRRIAERFGRCRVHMDQSIWVHAVSMGEVQAAASLVDALRERYPEVPLVLTTTTATAAARVKELFGERVLHAYLPYDLPFAVRSFLGRVRPLVGVILETEIWPNLYAQCERRGVQLLLASARLSERSVRRYRRLGRFFPGLLTQTLAGVRIAAQSRIDAQRFVAIGASPACVQAVGNLKFDFELATKVAAAAEDLRAYLGVDRPVWVAGSTHEGEEAVLLDAHCLLQVRIPAALLVLVPRHPQRFDAVAAELDRRGTRYRRRSQSPMLDKHSQVLLVDAMGQLLSFYAAADMTYVGGTLIARGGHNLLEPAALGRAVLCGPHTFNAPEIAAQLEQAGALQVVHSAQQLADTLDELLSDSQRRNAMGAAGKAVLERNRGVRERLLQDVAQMMKAVESQPNL